MALTPKEKEALKYLGVHLVYGIVGALTFGTAVLAIDLSHIRTLALASAHPVLVIVMMYWGLIITFGGVSMAVGIMNLAGDDEE